MKTPDEIKKGLETCIGKCTGNKPHCPYHECGDGCMDTMNRNALAYIQQLEKELAQERAIKKSTLSMDADGVSWCIEKSWISVEERLPEPYTSVLVYKTSNNKIVNYMTIDHIELDCNKELVWNGDKSWKYVITHWMPLPEPPVEE